MIYILSLFLIDQYSRFLRELSDETIYSNFFEMLINVPVFLETQRELSFICIFVISNRPKKDLEVPSLAALNDSFDERVTLFFEMFLTDSESNLVLHASLGKFGNKVFAILLFSNKYDDLNIEILSQRFLNMQQ